MSNSVDQQPTVPLPSDPAHNAETDVLHEAPLAPTSVLPENVAQQPGLAETAVLPSNTAPAATAPAASAQPSVPFVPAANPASSMPHAAYSGAPAANAYPIGNAYASAPQTPGQAMPPGAPGAVPPVPPIPVKPPRNRAKPRSRAFSPLGIGLTILELAAMGVAGLTVLGLLAGMIGMGLGLLLLFGLGIFVLIGAVYVIYGLSWFETQRIAGLYDVEIAPLRFTPRQHAGFKGWFISIAKQSIDGSMWRSMVSFIIASILGAIMLGCVQGMIRGFGSIFRTTSAWWQPGILGVLVSAAAIIGIALLHRIVTTAIVAGGAAEERLVAEVRETAAQRQGAVRAADVERTRIERDLHDGVQPRLVSVAMTLGLAQQMIDTNPEGAKALVAEAHTSTKAAITELRQLARGIYASVLDDRGLDAALSSLAARSHIPVQLDVRVTDRCSREAEAAIYFAIAESLTNAAKHSRASECRVVVRQREDNTLWARVEDNGVGVAHVVPGGGLDGVMNRVLAAGGTSRLDSPAGGPTTLEVSVPCAS